jgi:hypothetical protein
VLGGSGLEDLMANRKWLESVHLGAGEAIRTDPGAVATAAIVACGTGAATVTRPDAGRFIEDDELRLAENITLGYD